MRLTGSKAENVLHNSVPRKEREEWSVVALSPATGSNETGVSPLDYDWEKTARKLNAFYTDLASYCVKQRAALARTDQEISDIAHYLEFKRPGIADGYRTSMMLHSLRLRRRTIKDNIQCAGWFLTTTADAIIGGELERKLDTMKRRKYTPRVRTELKAAKANGLIRHRLGGKQQEGTPRVPTRSKEGTPRVPSLPNLTGKRQLPVF